MRRRTSNPPSRPLVLARSCSDSAAACDSLSRAVLASGRSLADCATAVDVHAHLLIGAGLVSSGGYHVPSDDFDWLPESPSAFPQDRVRRCETCGAPGQVRRCHYCGTLL